jgi:hypothetical protein
MDPFALLLILIVLVGTGVAAYYVYYLYEEKREKLKRGEIIIPQDEEERTAKRVYTGTITDALKRLLNVFYDGIVIEQLSTSFEEDGAPSYNECTAEFTDNIDVNVCWGDNELGFSWGWGWAPDGIDIAGPQCHLMTDKYDIQYFKTHSALEPAFQFRVDISENKISLKEFPDNLITINGLIQITPITDSGLAITQPKIIKLSDSVKLSCDDTQLEGIYTPKEFNTIEYIKFDE